MIFVPFGNFSGRSRHVIRAIEVPSEEAIKQDEVYLIIIIENRQIISIVTLSSSFLSSERRGALMTSASLYLPSLR